MKSFFKYFAFGVFLFSSSLAMESRHAIKLDSCYPESPTIHAYNGFLPVIDSIKLLSTSELRGQSPQLFAEKYYKTKPGASFHKAQDLGCNIYINIPRFEEIFEIPASSKAEFYITILYSSVVISDPCYKEPKSKNEPRPPKYTDPLFRPHYAYYNPETIGVGKAANFIRQYGIASFDFADTYCKARTCYMDTKTKNTVFSNQCWNSKPQNFSIHTDKYGNVRLSCDTPTINAVKRNAFVNNSCAVFYASKLPAGLSSQYEREIYGLILVLNEADEQMFNKDLESEGLLKALRNNPTLSHSNMALEVFPNLWK